MEEEKVEDKKWDPLCITSAQEMGHSALGFITPCCWVDPIFTDHKDAGRHGYDDLQRNLFTDDLKIKNNDTIDEILLSDQWLAFFDAVNNGPETAPTICKKYCWRAKKTQRKLEIK